LCKKAHFSQKNSFKTKKKENKERKKKKEKSNKIKTRSGEETSFRRE